MISINNLTKVYGKDHTVVDNTTWTAEDGQITGFIGHNGAGKTTTLKMITGTLKATSGSVTVNGYDVEKEPLKVKEQFGYVSDSPDHFLALKGIEYLNFIADVFNVSAKEREEFINTIAKKFGMYDALNSSILSYSHGMRQKIMLMGALIHNPSVWILDEPLTGLDPQSAYELKKMMREHVEKGNSVLFSTHVLEVAEKLCDKVVIIRKGKIQFTGSMDELKEKYSHLSSLEEIFLAISGGSDDE